MIWKMPPRIKVLEAEGCLADHRIKIVDQTDEKVKANVLSSSKEKTYNVYFYPQINAIWADDNGSKWRGYLGYPSIALLMLLNKIKYNLNISQALKNIEWKKINTLNKGDYSKTEMFVKDKLGKEGRITSGEIDDEINSVLEQIKYLEMRKPGGA